MFTSLMFEKLSDWLANVSILVLGSTVLPLFVGNGKLVIHEFAVGVLLVILCLWLSLRSARLADKKYGRN